MSDPIERILKDQLARASRSIALIQNGYKRTTEMRDNEMVDTTQETLADELRIQGELIDALARHEARSANRP